MADMDPDSAGGNDNLLSETWIVHCVGVSTDRLNRRDHAKLLENLIASNITRVENEIDSLQRLVNRSAEKSMRI